MGMNVSESHTCGENRKLFIYMYRLFARVYSVYAFLPYLCAFKYFHMYCYNTSHSMDSRVVWSRS